MWRSRSAVPGASAVPPRWVTNVATPVSSSWSSQPVRTLAAGSSSPLVAGSKGWSRTRSRGGCAISCVPSSRPATTARAQDRRRRPREYRRPRLRHHRHHAHRRRSRHLSARKGAAHSPAPPHRNHRDRGGDDFQRLAWRTARHRASRPPPPGIGYLLRRSGLGRRIRRLRRRLRRDVRRRRWWRRLRGIRRRWRLQRRWRRRRLLA